MCIIPQRIQVSTACRVLFASARDNRQEITVWRKILQVLDKMSRTRAGIILSSITSRIMEFTQSVAAILSPAYAATYYPSLRTVKYGL